MGMLYRRKQKDDAGKPVEVGPWWMKIYDDGRPIYASTRKLDKREAYAAMVKEEGKIAEGRREGPLVRRIRFEDLVECCRSCRARRREPGHHLHRVRA